MTLDSDCMHLAVQECVFPFSGNSYRGHTNTDIWMTFDSDCMHLANTLFLQSIHSCVFDSVYQG